MSFEIKPDVFGVQVAEVLKPYGINELRFRITDASRILRHGDTIVTKYNRIAGDVVAVAQPEEDMPPVYWVRTANVIGLMTDLARHQIEEQALAVATQIYVELPEPARLLLDACVFPSEERTIVSIVTDEKFNGAHDYEIKPMLRYDNGTVYGLEGMPITFVKRLPDGTFRPGIQTEQLLHMILDRHPKLNAEFPTDTHDEFMGHIQAAVGCLERRFRERIDRGVAGEHKA